MTQATTWTAAAGNANDVEYGYFLQEFAKSFEAHIAGGKPLLTTDIDPQSLWSMYIGSFHAEERQHHNCNACRHFVMRFGGLAIVDDAGGLRSPIWNEQIAPAEYFAPIRHLAQLVERARVNGVFLSGEATLGTTKTGMWRHMSVDIPIDRVYGKLTLTPGQAMAEKREDFKNVTRALGAWPQHIIAQALDILKSDALYRSEKVLGAAQWLYDLHALRSSVHNQRARDALTWRAIALAPAGFCHPRSSMIGTLLDDLSAALPFETVKRNFADKMRPTQYQRPQAAPAAGNIAAAEKIFEQLGAARSLERRAATLEDIICIWAPREWDKAKPEGVFGHLKAESPPKYIETTGAQRVTFEKFRRTVLPYARQIEVHLPHVKACFTGFVTAVHFDAPPILQWDSAPLPRNPVSWYPAPGNLPRNPVSWYLYTGGSYAENWSLHRGYWVKATAISELPHMWGGRTMEHHKAGAVFMLDGCRDTQDPGLCLFPEILSAEFHGVRAVIEAHSKSKRLADTEKGTANGLDVIGATVRVTTPSGAAILYKIDRWD